MKSPLVSLSENQVGQNGPFFSPQRWLHTLWQKISVATWQRSRAASLWSLGPYIPYILYIPILFPYYSHHIHLDLLKKSPSYYPHEIPWLPHMFTGPVLLVTSTVHPAYVDKCTLITWILPQRWPISFYIPIDIIIFLAFSNVPSISPAFSCGLATGDDGSSASSQHLQTRSRRPVACVYSRTEEMVSSGMDSSSIRFSQKFEHPKSSPYDFSYFSLPPILSVAHMLSDNSWELIQCHRLLALTHESTIWLALHTTSWNIRKVNPNVEVSGSPDTVLSGGEPQCWDTLGALDLFFRSLQYRPTWGSPI